MECVWEIVIDTVIFMIYIILNVILCLILTLNISANYVLIFLKYYYYDHHYTFFEVMRRQARHNCPAYVSFLRILAYARLSSHDITLIRESVGARHSTMVVAEEI